MAVESGARASKTLSGELRSRPLAVLLAGTCERGTSGTFVFRHGTRRDSLTMRAGKIAVVRTSEPTGYLGGILYEHGAIDMRTLDETLHEVATSKRLHGEILLQRGAITVEQLEEALAEQMFRKVNHLFSLPDEATWSFRDDADELTDARDEGRPPIETWRAIWRGIRDREPAAHVKKTLAKIEGGIHLRDFDVVQRFGFGPEEAAICERLHAQPLAIERVLATSTIGADRMQSLVYVLALTRSIVRIEVQPVGPADLGAEGIRERARRIDREDPYTALGLREDATLDAVRAAYFRLARLWHPDRLPASLADLRLECDLIFARLGQAHRSISASMRMWQSADAFLTENGGVIGPCANDSVAPPASSVAPPPLETRQTLRDVDAALARSDIAGADAIARSLANTGDSGPGARAAMAWCALGTDANTNPAAVEKALAALDKVLTADPDCVRGLFFRAQILKRAGRIEAAFRDYRKVVRLDPRHVDAQREVRLYDMRRKSGASSVALPAAAAPPSTRTSEPRLVAPPSASGPASSTDKAAESAMRAGLRRLMDVVTRK